MIGALLFSCLMVGNKFEEFAKFKRAYHRVNELSVMLKMLESDEQEVRDAVVLMCKLTAGMHRLESEEPLVATDDAPSRVASRARKLSTFAVVKAAALHGQADTIAGVEADAGGGPPVPCALEMVTTATAGAPEAMEVSEAWVPPAVASPEGHLLTSRIHERDTIMAFDGVPP